MNTIPGARLVLHSLEQHCLIRTELALSVGLLCLLFSTDGIGLLLFYFIEL